MWRYNNILNTSNVGHNFRVFIVTIRLTKRSISCSSFVVKWLGTTMHFCKLFLNTFRPLTGLLGPLHMSPVTGLARLPGRILWCVHMGNFSPVDRDEFKKQPKWWNINLYCSQLSRLNSHTSKVEILTRSKLCHFLGRYVLRAKLFCLKSFVPVTGLECSYGKIFIPVTEISVTGPARSLMNTSIFLPEKRAARRDLGNRANPVDRAHMKRPLVV